MLMWLALAEMNVDAIWKMKTDDGSPCASSVRVPLRLNGPVDLYTPAVSVRPTKSPATVALGARPAASL